MENSKRGNSPTDKDHVKEFRIPTKKNSEYLLISSPRGRLLIVTGGRGQDVPLSSSPRPGAAWAVVYRVLQSDYDESRSVNQFEEDMFLPSEGLNYRCSPRTIAMGMQNNTVLRSKPEAWEQEGAKSRILTLRDAFRGVLKELL